MSIAEFPNNSNRTRNSAAEFERTPPQDVIAEQSVLGGMLLSKDAISDVVEILRERDFYRPAHELIYDAIFQSPLFKDPPRLPIIACNSGSWEL